MISLTRIESKYLEFLQDEISVSQFGEWVYDSSSLENEMSSDEYLNLISFNFNSPMPKYELSKILHSCVNFGKIETHKMITLLHHIQYPDGSQVNALRKTYDLYCKGYYFLKELAIDFGLAIMVPLESGVDNYEDLSSTNQADLINSFYPQASDLAQEIIELLLQGEIELTGTKDHEFDRWEYIDNRD